MEPLVDPWRETGSDKNRHAAPQIISLLLEHPRKQLRVRQRWASIHRSFHCATRYHELLPVVIVRDFSPGHVRSRTERPGSARNGRLPMETRWNMKTAA